MGQFNFLQPGRLKFHGYQNDNVRFVQQWQLMDRALWAKFVNQFRTHSDGAERTWRGEYWGKMMRGACLTYVYTKDKALYAVLEETVRDILSTQDILGRISTYTVETELHGWDMWCRKYVLTGLQHFYAICEDEVLKKQMLCAMCRHADAIMDKVGPGKLHILDTSHIWGSVNSCTVLEPTVALYSLTNNEKYLDFARYILSTGGSSDGNLIETALENRLLPHEYPTRKAYEVMSFFEGVLAYYEVTGEERYFRAVSNFMDKVMAHEISTIGCAGCEHELFDHTAQSQTTSEADLQQETCVTVTYMRMLTRLLMRTGDVKYAHALEIPAYNAMPGSINHFKQAGFNYWGDKKPTEPFPFDSYSPLRDMARGLGVGGIQPFAEGGAYGCCACIGSAGVALIPLTAIMKSEQGFVINDHYSGTVSAVTPAGNPIEMTSAGEYLQKGTYRLTMYLKQSERFTVKIRIPAWCPAATVQIGEKTYQAEPGYLTVTRLWTDRDEITITTPMKLRSRTQDGLTAYFYGPLALCADAAKQENIPCEWEQYRTVHNGILLTDYASCGKHWNRDCSQISVWI